MLDQNRNGLPRIALVYGQAAAVEHLRDALEGRVEIVYAAAAGEFDAACMTAAHAAVALVNMDEGDWLEDIEPRLLEAGVAMVYNDPEISRGLDGWERARWLRHLVAKLSGSREVDPPRPASADAHAPAGVGADMDPMPDAPVEVASEPVATVAAPAAAVAELPLSSEEIESMTVALAAEQDPANAVPSDGAAVARQSPADMMAMDLAVEEAAASATGMRPAATMGTGVAQPAASQDTGFDTDQGLDVDTEALSAMIDARLAEPETTAPSDSSQVWRVVGDDTVASAQSDDMAATPVAQPRAATPARSAAQDDADVLASLPSLDDWALVDPELPVAKTAVAAGKVSDSALLNSLAGLELVPMETIAPVHVHTDPIERWLHESEPVKPRAGSDAAAKASGGKS